jgi:hypothetical protein
MEKRGPLRNYLAGHTATKRTGFSPEDMDRLMAEMESLRLVVSRPDGKTTSYSLPSEGFRTKPAEVRIEQDGTDDDDFNNLDL